MYSMFNKELSSIRRRRLAEGTTGAGSNIEEPEAVNPTLSGMWTYLPSAIQLQY